MVIENLKHVKSGKVRDIYDLGENYLFVASDRISAFDYVLPSTIPKKGEILTQLSLFWFDFFKDTINNHLVEGDFSKFPSELQEYKELAGRSIIVKKADPFPVECVVRGYISGSGWSEYKNHNSVCGIDLSPGLIESQKLSEPIFTPATKEELGNHDINISLEEMCNIIGKDVSLYLQDKSKEIYSKAASYALERGIIIADTKFEFGLVDGEIILIDEVLTPDSSRFWPIEKYSPGRTQDSFDKQFVRDYLLEIKWDKEPPIPKLPNEVIEGTTQRYLQAYNEITCKELK